MRNPNGQKSFAYRRARVWNDLDSKTELAEVGIIYSMFQIETKHLHGPPMSDAG